MTRHRRANGAEAQESNVHGMTSDEGGITCRSGPKRTRDVDAGRSSGRAVTSTSTGATPRWAPASRCAPTPRATVVDYRSRVVSILTISGMVAVHAKRAVFTALAGVPGVTSAEVDLGRAVVQHEPSVSPDALSEAVSLAGCTVTDVRMERRLPLSG